MKISRQILYSFILLSLVIALTNTTSATPAFALGTIITVNTTDGTVTTNGNCSFPEAMEAASDNVAVDTCPAGSSSSIDTIRFQISGAGVQTITLTAGLSIFDDVLIDGTTQTGYSGTPLIRVDGGGTLTNPLINFDSGSSGSTLKGMMLTGTQFGSFQINTDNITVVGNYLQTDGTNFLGGSGGNSSGAAIESGSNNVIGGTTAADRNLISGTTGVYLEGGSNNVIEGNYIGVQTGGNTPISGEVHSGVFVTLPFSGTTSNNTIKNNVIGGFSLNGIYLAQGTSGTTIQGNKIGVGVDGTTIVGNGQAGIFILGSPSNTIGGNIVGERNIISGNGESDIHLEDHISPNFSDNNTIQGNYIGTDVTGETSLSSSTYYGIWLDGGDDNQIGGAAPGQGNLISGFTNATYGYGIYLALYPTSTKIYGNFIGTNKEGTSALSNKYGIYLWAKPAAIGDGTLSGGNLISGNTTDAIFVDDTGASGTVISRNKIGTNLSGSGAIPNGNGIELFNNSGAGTQITKNWISHNITDGVLISNSSIVAAGSTNNCFTGNTTYGVVGPNAGPSAPFDHNWWGAASGPGSVGPGSGDHVSLNITFSPFLTAAAAACSPVVSLNSSSLNFGNQLVGTSSALKTLTLTNIGGKLMHLTSITATSPFSRDISSTCPAGAGTLMPGASCTIKIKFSPTTIGLVTHNLTINSDAATSPNHVTLKGTGVVGTPLLKNPGFEIDANHDNKPDTWSFTNFNLATDSRDCTVHKNGLCSLKLAGNSLQKVASQTITKSGVAGDDFTFSLWNLAGSIPVGSISRLQVLFYQGSILRGNKTMNFTLGSHPFQKVSGAFTAPTAYTKIVYKIIFKANSGTAWFDTATLNWAP